jgi:DNA-binding NarL/FixJ family response regulator
MQIYESDIPGAQSDHFDPSVLLSNALIELDRLADAEEVLRVTPRVGRPGIHLAPAHLFARARLCFLSGRWDDALAEIRADDDLPDGYGYRRPMRSLAGIIALRRGRPTPDPDALIDPDDQPGSRAYRHFEWWARALACESQGRPQEALEVLVDAHRRFGSGVTSPTMYYLYPDLARLAHLLDAGQAAEEVAAAAEETAEHRPSHSRRATAALCRGLAESRPELLEVAARSFRLAHRPLFEAQAHESLATLLAQAGRTGAADALGRALELYGGIEANWDSARAEARLRAAGVRRGKRGPRGRPKSGWAALTPTELKVAELVVQGLSNLDIAGQLFLSRRTVATHISSILGKLGLQSRVQLAVSYAKQH